MIEQSSMNPIFKIFLFVLFSAMIQHSFGQRLNGRIVSYHDNYYTVHESYGKVKKGIKLTDSLYHDQQVTFDQNGNVAEAIEYNFDGTIHCRYAGKLDCPDNHIESVYLRVEPKISIDRKPFLVESAKYPSGEMCVITYKNDPNGHPAEEIIYDLMGSILSTVKIIRDKSGHPLEYLFSDGTVFKFKYDGDGTLTEWFSKSSTGRTVVSTYQYDDHGNVVEEIVKDFFKSSYKYHYEENTFRYRYDKQGNWIERVELEHNVPMRLVVRTIEYGS